MSFLKSLFSSRKKSAQLSNGNLVPFAVKDSDVFIVSYPKSGNTWVRFLLGNYLTNNQFSFINSNDLIPDMHAHPEKCKAIEGLRLIKSHFSYTPELNKVIYIVRDSRDVAVSYYYYYLKYVYNKDEVKPTFTEFFDLFMKGEVGFGLWSDHVDSWLDNASKNFLLVRYEDLVSDTEEIFKKILLFVYGRYDAQKMVAAVQASDFSQMAEREQKERMMLPRNAASDATISFVRKGQPGDYTNYFSSDQEKLLLERFKLTMKRVNYIK